MAPIWLGIIAIMLAIYAVLDGFDLGSGIIHLFVARTGAERQSLLEASGTVWDGNELWLLLAGGTLYCAFPAAFQSNGFVFAIGSILALLALRSSAMALRPSLASVGARRRLDIAFALASVLLSLTLGCAAGFLIVAVTPTPASQLGAWFPALCGLSAFAVLTLQSAVWMALKTAGSLQVRCRRLASATWWAVLLCAAAITGAGVAVAPHVLENLLAHSSISILVVVSLAGLMATRLCLSVDFDLGAFAGASCVIAGFLASVASGQFPDVLRPLNTYTFAAHTAATSQHGIAISALWWIPAFLLAAGYNLRMHGLFRSHATVRPSSNVLAAGR